jgi:hypothetical protein
MPVRWMLLSTAAVCLIGRFDRLRRWLLAEKGAWRVLCRRPRRCRRYAAATRFRNSNRLMLGVGFGSILLKKSVERRALP